MATAPKFKGSDGALRSQYAYSTTLPTAFLNGEVDPTVVDMQVRVQGASAFTSNPDMITFQSNPSGTASVFLVPNPAAHPEGLALLQGANTVEVRAVLANGQTTSTATATIYLSAEKDTGAVFLAPTGVSTERFDQTVKISVEGLSDPYVIGYNFYASTQAGGGTAGYSRLNIGLVSSGVQIERTSEIGVLEVEALAAKNPDGSPKAVPQYLVINGTQQDSADTVLQADFNEALEIPDATTRVRFEATVSSVDVAYRYSFEHDRNSTFGSALNPSLPNTLFNALGPEDPVFYVVTAVYEVNGVQYESAFSPEVAAAPMPVTTNVGSLPAVSRQSIVRDMVLSIFRSQPQVDVKPGSVLRDTVIDPFSSEAERVRLIVDFLYRASSFATLLQIDDPTFSGVSVAVNQSPYKLALQRAFFLDSTFEVQALIDNAFERIASNFGKTRRPGTRSRGEITFISERRPTATMTFGIGTRISGGGVVVSSTSLAQITPSGAGANFNPSTGRYVARAFVQSEVAGSVGNVAAGALTTVLNGPSGGRAVNESPLFGGRDQESNLDLAVRSLSALSGVDTGTLQGYVATAIDVPGVAEVNVIEAGHPLMFRDLDDSGAHLGGKVDVWVRGENLISVSDRFAFSFKIAQNMQFVPYGNPSELKFRVIDPNVTADTPLMEMLDYPSINYVFRNISKGVTMGLTDVQVIAFNTIQLSAAHNDPTLIALSDKFTGSYRFRTSNRHVFKRQPVRSILTFTGDATRTGTVASDYYHLYHPTSPLNLGRSTKSGDYLKVTIPVGSTLSIPSSEPMSTPSGGESHVMLDGIEYLNNLGVNPITVAVWNADRSVQYRGPYTPGGLPPDFTLIEGDEGTPLAVKITAGSRIVAGAQVQVDYLYDENFFVVYETNSLVSVVQESLDEMRHATADVLAKEAIPIPVDLGATLVLKNGSSTPTAGSNVRTDLARLFANLRMGQPLRQSDTVEVLDSAALVSYVVVPLAQMTMGDGSVILRESVPTDTEEDFFQVGSPWSTSTVTFFLLGVNTSLEYATSTGGGPANEYREVAEGLTPYLLFNSPPEVSSGVPLRYGPYRAHIIGSEGLAVPGHSDHATVKGELYPGVTVLTAAQEAAVQAQMVTKSANRVIVTLPTGTSLDDTPLGRNFYATYFVAGDSGVKNVTPNPTEYLTLGNLNLIYDEDSDFTQNVQGRRSL